MVMFHEEHNVPGGNFNLKSVKTVNIKYFNIKTLVKF